jgi:hypothetical protein
MAFLAAGAVIGRSAPYRRPSSRDLGLLLSRLLCFANRADNTLAVRHKAED